MSKLKSLLTHLERANSVLQILDGMGIDVDRMVGNSKTRGKITNIVRSSISVASGIVNDLEGRDPSNGRLSSSLVHDILFENFPKKGLNIEDGRPNLRKLGTRSPNKRKKKASRPERKLEAKVKP